MMHRGAPQGSWKRKDLEEALRALGPELERVRPRVVAHYQQLHRHPELSWQEENTAAYVEKELRAFGLSPRRIAGTGVIVDLPGGEDLPRRALRADMDAVAAHEATGLPYASAVPGVMHACGHDAHTSILLGVAEILSTFDRRPRPLRLIFQPAEEVVPSGAQRLVEDGVLDGVDEIVGLHVWPPLPSGTLGLRNGVVTAAADAFECKLTGPGGHGARPHEAVDLIALAARIITSLLDLPRTHLDPLRQPAVISIGSLHAGESFNVLPDELNLAGTVRTMDAAARAELAKQMEAVIRNLAGPVEAEYTFHYRTGPPLVRNDADLVRLARHVGEVLLGRERVSEVVFPSMGSEDFGHFTERLPGILMRLGCGPAGGGGHPLHSNQFHVDETTLATGVEVLAGLAIV